MVAGDMHTILDFDYYDLCIEKGHLGEIRTHIRSALLVYRNDGHVSRKENTLISGVGDIEGLTAEVAGELFSERRHLNSILENLSEGVIGMNREGVVVSMNNAAQKILDHSAEEMIGSPLVATGWGSHQAEVEYWLQERTDSAEQEQLDILGEAPLFFSEKIVTASFVAVYEQGGRFNLCILRDITRQFRAEEENRTRDTAIKLITKMDAMSCMAGGIAHDFNNLLTVICGNLDMLTQAGKRSDGEQLSRAMLEHARTAAYMAVELTRKISSSSPFGIVSRDSVDLDDIVSSVLEDFAKEHKVPYKRTPGTETSMVQIDSSQVKTALANILQNAMEADPAGEIEVHTKLAEYEEPLLMAGQYVPAGCYCCVTVQDRGEGIDQDQLLNIFDPYYSTKARGASRGVGLGLTVVYATFRNHGGYVVVDSEPGKGTAVSCFLPCYQTGTTEKKNTNESADQQRKTASPPKVLLIEKDNQLQQIGKAMLDYLNHDVEIVDGLSEGLAYLRAEREQGGETTQFVILDPASELLEHQEICSALKEQNSELKIIVTGRSIFDSVVEDCRQYGYSNALPKPFTVDSLRHVLVTAGK